MTTYAPDAATARADMCRFLSACFYEPTEAFGEEKLFDSLVTAAAQVSAELVAPAQRLRDAFFAESMQNLLVDYTRLFLGPLELVASPYGSAWLPAPAAPTDDHPPAAVLAYYSEGGLDVDETFMELPDHIAVELEFLYLLTFGQAQALREGRPADAQRAAQLQQRFLHDQLGTWVGRFAAAVNAGAQTDFYRELANLTERFVQLQISANEARG